MFRFNLTQRNLKCLVKIDSTPSINDIKMILKLYVAEYELQGYRDDRWSWRWNVSIKSWFMDMLPGHVHDVDMFHWTRKKQHKPSWSRRKRFAGNGWKADDWSDTGCLKLSLWKITDQLLALQWVILSASARRLSWQPFENLLFISRAGRLWSEMRSGWRRQKSALKAGLISGR